MSLSKFKSLGIECFLAREFNRALFYFSLAFKEDPNDKELRMFIILTDLAAQKEEEAYSLFEYYTLNEENSTENDALLEEIIDSLEIGPDKLLSIFENQILQTHIDEEDGISYDDFMELVKTRSFKEAFENIMFSTKVIISKKEDFIDFLDKLIEHGFIDISFKYLENAVSIFPNEIKFHNLLKKAHGSKHS
ncbi:MAG: tetratricopeptide repeat protein [Sulfurospirillaceae bacterium]